MLLTWTPVCAIKGGTNGYIYVPNLPVKTLKIQLWCNDSNPSRMQGDQTGGTSPYPNIPEYPDGAVALKDFYFIQTYYGGNEGGTTWNYMADCVPDRTIDLKDVNTVQNNYGQSGGSYSSDLTGIKVVFSNGTTGYPNAEGFVSIPSGATYFYVYKDNTPVMALVYFFAEELVTYTLTLNVDKTTGYIGDIFTFSGALTSDGVGVGGVTATLFRDSLSVGSAVTASDGTYTIPWTANVVGTYDFHTEAVV